MSRHKLSQQECFSRLGAQGSAIAALDPLAVQRCVEQTRVLFLSLSHSGRDHSSIYSKGLLVMLERVGRLVCLGGCTNNAISTTNLPGFYFIYLGLDWLGIQFVFHILTYWNPIIITRLPIILSSVTSCIIFISSVLLHINILNLRWLNDDYY